MTGCPLRRQLPFLQACVLRRLLKTENQPQPQNQWFMWVDLIWLGERVWVGSRSIKIALKFSQRDFYFSTYITVFFLLQYSYTCARVRVIVFSVKIAVWLQQKLVHGLFRRTAPSVRPTCCQVCRSVEFCSSQAKSDVYSVSSRAVLRYNWCLPQQWRTEIAPGSVQYEAILNCRMAYDFWW